MKELYQISIVKSPSSDDRMSAGGQISKDDLVRSTKMHQQDVAQAMRVFMNKIEDRISMHDHTKIEYMDDFYDAINSGHMKNTAWYQMHATEERHHLFSHVPDDVNIVDVVECICDCVMAGLARSGNVYDINFPPELLALAVRNTVEYLKRITTVSTDDAEVDLMKADVED